MCEANTLVIKIIIIIYYMTDALERFALNFHYIFIIALWFGCSTSNVLQMKAYNSKDLPDL